MYDKKPSALSKQTEFLKLFLKHQDDLRAFIGAVVRDVSQRDDIFQEVAMALWKAFDNYDPERSFGAWARGVARNRVLKHYRSAGRNPLSMTPAAVEATLNAFDAIEDSGVHDDWKEALESCLNQLPSRSRRILSMRYNRETDIDTMASKLGKTAAAIYQSLSRIRKQLELCMRKRLGTIS